MACIAGTVDNPKLWYTKDGWPVVGRRPDGGAYCPRRSPYTSVSLAHRRVGHKLASCNGCPCFRGVDAFGVLQEGYTPDMRYVTSFTEAEWEKWTELDFDWPAFMAWKDQTARAPSSIARRGRFALTDEQVDVARAYGAEQQRRWRAAHPGADKRKRNRRDYMREYMRKRRALARDDYTQPTPSVQSD